MTKVFGPFFLTLSSVINLKENFIRVHKVFWHLLWKFCDQLFRIWEVVEIKIFWKERQSFRRKKDFGLFFLTISRVKNLREQFLRVQRQFEIYCGSYNIISVTPKRLLKTQSFEKKANFPVKKRFWPVFFSFYRVWGTSVTIYKGSKKFFDIYCGGYKITSLGHYWFLKTQIFEEKKGTHLVNQRFWPVFFSYYRVWETSVTIYKGSKRFFDIYCRGYKITSLGHYWFLKTQIFEEEKKAPILWTKDFGLFFLVISSVRNPRNTLQGSTRGFDNYCGSNKIICSGPERLLKSQSFEKERQPFRRKKEFDVFLPILSSVINLREQFLGVHKAIWQILWKLKDPFFNTREFVENTIFRKKLPIFPLKTKYWPTFSRTFEYGKQ